LSETIDLLSLQRVVDKLNALVAKAHYEQETQRYWVDADDWRELREFASSIKEALAERAREIVGHAFSTSGLCSGCGMKKNYFERATAILESWPEDSEKGERLAELKTCKNPHRSNTPE
jgi:hypothetical protein